MLSTGHLLLIFMIVFLIFGAKRLPEIAKSFGQAINEFKKGKDEIVDAVTKPQGNAVASAPSADNKTDATANVKEPAQKLV